MDTLTIASLLIFATVMCALIINISCMQKLRDEIKSLKREQRRQWN